VIGFIGKVVEYYHRDGIKYYTGKAEVLPIHNQLPNKQDKCKGTGYKVEIKKFRVHTPFFTVNFKIGVNVFAEHAYS
jgi:hypothetical protein